MFNRLKQGGTPVAADVQTSVLNSVGVAVQDHSVSGEGTRTGSGQAITIGLQGATALGLGTVVNNQTQPVNHQASVVAGKHKRATINAKYLRESRADDKIVGADALYRRANDYKNGDGVRQNLRKAFKLYMKASREGHAEAQFMVANMLSSGAGVRQNDTNAVEYYRKAAAQGLPDALYNLASMYKRGCGVQQDHVEAYKLYLLLAEQGDANAQFDIAMHYVMGQGVAEDRIKALKWFGLAAANGHQDGLSVVYDCAHGVDLDLTDSQDAELCRIAIEIQKRLDV